MDDILVETGKKFVTDSPIDAFGEDDDIIKTVKKHDFRIIGKRERIVGRGDEGERWLKLTVIANRDITFADAVEMTQEAEVEYFLGDVGISNEVLKSIYDYKPE